MTRAYYTERLLPVYADEIHQCRLQHHRSCIFQKNNNLNHDTKSIDNIARRFKTINWLTTLTHSPQSFDLNPIEGMWNILKQRVFTHRIYNVAELKRVILEE